MDDLPENHSHRYLPAVEEALLRSGMTQTRFGYIHFGDPAFVKRMRDGHHLRKKTIERIHRVLDSI